MDETINDSANDDGTITRTTTKDYGDGNQDITVRIYTQDQFQQFQNEIQAKISDLTAQLSANQNTLSSRLGIKSQLTNQ